MMEMAPIHCEGGVSQFSIPSRVILLECYKCLGSQIINQRLSSERDGYLYMEGFGWERETFVSYICTMHVTYYARASGWYDTAID